MRIAVWHNLPSGGAKRALRLQVSGLVAAGHHVEVWCPTTAERDFLPLADLVTEHVLPLSDRGRSPLRGHQPQLRAVERHCRACAEEITAAGFDVVVAHNCRFSTAPPLARFVDIPTALYLQEPTRQLFEAHPILAWLETGSPAQWRRPTSWVPRRVRDMVRVHHLRARAAAEIANAAGFDLLLTNSLFSAESVLRCYGLGARVCYLGVDRSWSAPPQDGGRERLVLGVGQISRHKGVDLAVEAVGRLPEPRPPLVWVGHAATPEYLAEVRQLAGERDVDLRTTVDATDPHLRRLFRRAGALLCTGRLEPFGLTALEAGACGLPVVAIAEGGYRETVVDGVNGLLAAPTPQALGDALKRVLADPALADRLGAGGHRLVEERWTAAAACARLDAVLADLASARS